MSYYELLREARLSLFSAQRTIENDESLYVKLDDLMLQIEDLMEEARG